MVALKVLWIIVFIALMIIIIYREKNIFHPIFFFLLMQFIGYCLPLIANSPSWFTDYSYGNIIMLISNETLFIIMVLIGYYLIRFPKKSAIINSGEKNRDYTNSEHEISSSAIYLFFLIGMISRIVLIYKMGGFLYVLANPHVAYASLISGMGIYNILTRFMLIAIVCMFEKIKRDKNLKNILIFIFMSIFYMGSFLIYSSRGPALELVFIILCCISMGHKNISIKDFIKPKYLLIILIVLFIAVFEFNRRVNSNDSSLKSGINILINEFNRIDRDIVTYNYFKTNSFWHGEIYKNIIYIFIPSSLFPNKPIIDDGIFLTQIINGSTVDPSLGRLELDLTIGSTPFTTQGLAYANFGYLGIIVFGLLLGFIYRKVFEITKTHNNALNCLIYFYVIYMFGFTPLYIQNVISVVIFALIGKFIIYKNKYFRFELIQRNY